MYRKSQLKETCYWVEISFITVLHPLPKMCNKFTKDMSAARGPYLDQLLK